MTTPLPIQDPIAELVEEHARFRSETRGFLELVERARERLTPQPLEASRVEEFARYLELEVDGRHGSKEEQALFPVLAQYVPAEGGPVSVLLAEHQDLRTYRKALAAAARKLDSDLSDPWANRTTVSETRAVHQLLDLHIEKEESVLFPMARGLLTPSDLSELREAFARINDEWGPNRSVPPPPPVTSQGIPLPPFCAAGRARRDRAERRSPG